MNRIDRLTGMILQLQAQQGITAGEMAAHWEVSLRTVYRDLAALGEAGVPVACDPGAGYRLMKGYHVPPVMFTADEASALFVSGEVTEQIAEESLRRALRSALLKIRSVLPEERRQYLARLKQSVGVWLHATRPATVPSARCALHDAVLRRLCVALRYNTAGRGDLTRRVVEPLGVVFYGNQWHLIAYCRLRRDFRDFRLDRMAEWEVLAETFSGHGEFSVHKFLEDVIRCHELIPATVVAEKAVADRVRSGMLSTPGREEALPDGRIRIEILCFSLEWLARWLLGFGESVVAERPAALRREMREAALAVAAKYPNKSRGTDRGCQSRVLMVPSQPIPGCGADTHNTHETQCTQLVRNLHGRSGSRPRILRKNPQRSPGSRHQRRLSDGHFPSDHEKESADASRRWKAAGPGPAEPSFISMSRAI